MQGIILAAGMGKRLKELTRNNTKCMVEVNGISLIERTLRILDQENLSRVVIVVGYKGENLKKYISTLDIKTEIVYIDNPIYDTTNNIYSLALAKNYLAEEDTLLFESDLIFDKKIVDRVIEDPRPTLAVVDKFESWMDGTCMKLDEEDRVADFIPGKYLKFGEKDDYYKTVNIYKFSKEFSAKTYMPFLSAYEKAMGENEYYESVLKLIAMLDNTELRAMRLNGEPWYEIDNAQDLDIAEVLFTTDKKEKYARLCHRFGGFWRFPKMLDFCYLVNPYFPPKKMVDELKANFDTLLREYPSGMKVNSLLAAKNFDVHQANIIVGNGAAELIKSLMSQFSGKTGFVRPTFEEYPHRYDEENSVNFIPENKDYSYTADDLMNFFADKPIDNLVVVNPDNPSGNYIKKADLLRLVDWAKNKGIKLLIDESFVDFADEEDHTLIDQAILDANPHLSVMKSISKSYGVPGLRLGVLASGDQDIIAKMKKDVAIWNINSFGEFYMQIEEKYKKDYAKALIEIRSERARFQGELGKIKGIRVIPSQANYVMVELDKNISPKSLLKVLLLKHSILIKELTSKTGGKGYLRLAVRNQEDNDKLIAALKTELM